MSVNLDYELDVAVSALRLIQAGGDPLAISRGALAMISPEAHPEWHPEGETLSKGIWDTPTPTLPIYAELPGDEDELPW